jgi:hypothetical protein
MRGQPGIQVIWSVRLARIRVLVEAASEGDANGANGLGRFSSGL